MASSHGTTSTTVPDASSVAEMSSKKGIAKSMGVSPLGCLCDPSDQEDVPECSICLQPCIHAVQLPCTHVFCFLCVKGVANQSKKCALCRQEIPSDFLYKPLLLRKEELEKEVAFDGGYQWFYEGNRGWWQYDERASSEIEERFKKEEKGFEMLIAGFLYVIDIENMIQYRRNDPTRRRKIKRDLTSIPDKKGVAGLQCGNKTTLRKDGDGGEQDNRLAQAALPQPSGAPLPAPQPSQTAPPLPPRMCNAPLQSSPESSSINTSTNNDDENAANRSQIPTICRQTPTHSDNRTTDSHEHSDLSQPHNSPQTPEIKSDSEDADGEGSSESDNEQEPGNGEEDIAIAGEMLNLRLRNSSRHSQQLGQFHIPPRSSRPVNENQGHNTRMRLSQSPSSSDSEWD